MLHRIRIRLAFWLLPGKCVISKTAGDPSRQNTTTSSAAGETRVWLWEA